MKTLILSFVIVVFTVLIASRFMPSKETYLDVSRTILREVR